MKAVLIALLLLCLAASLALGATDPAKALEQKVSLSVADVDAHDAVKSLAEKAGIPILMDDTIQDKVTASMQDLTVSKALTALCASKKWTWKLAYLPSGTGAGQATAAVSMVNSLRSDSVILQDPAAGTTTILLSNPAPDKVKLAELAESLGLTPAIVIAAKPAPISIGKPANTDPNRVTSRFGPPKPGTQPAVNNQVPVMANQMINAFRQLPIEQQMQLMGEIRRQMFDNMTPEQRDQIQHYFRSHRRGDDGRLHGN